MSPSFDLPENLTELEQLSIWDWEGDTKLDGVGERELVRQMIDPATPPARLEHLVRIRGKTSGTGFRLHAHIPTLMAFYSTEIHRLSEDVGGLYSFETIQAFLTDGQSKEGQVLGLYLMLLNPSLPMKEMNNIVFGSNRGKMLFLKYNPSAMFQVADPESQDSWRIFFYDLLLEEQKFDDFDPLFSPSSPDASVQFSQAQAISFFREHISPRLLLPNLPADDPRARVPLLYEENDPAKQLAIVAELFPRIRKAPQPVYQIYYTLRLMVQGKPVPQKLLMDILARQFPPSDTEDPPVQYLASILRAAASLHGMVGWPIIPRWFLEATGFADAFEIVPPPSPPPAKARRNAPSRKP